MSAIARCPACGVVDTHSYECPLDPNNFSSIESKESAAGHKSAYHRMGEYHGSCPVCRPESSSPPTSETPETKCFICDRPLLRKGGMVWHDVSQDTDASLNCPLVLHGIPAGNWDRRLREREGMVLVPRKQIMGNLSDLAVGDYVEVRYKDGSGKIKGRVTKLWESPHAQAQVENGWCFHVGDEILVHDAAVPAVGEKEKK